MNAFGIDTAAAAATLRTLGNETRLQIVLRLLRGEAAVAELERELGLRQPNLSQQLAELRDAGLVVSRREAKSVIYRLADEERRRLAAAILQGFGGAVQISGPVPGRAAARARQVQAGAVFARVLATG